MIEESKYCSNVMKKHFNKELIKSKEVIEILRTLLYIGFMIMVKLIMILK